MKIHYDINYLKPNAEKEIMMFQYINMDAKRNFKINWRDMYLEHLNNLNYPGVKPERGVTSYEKNITMVLKKKHLA